MRVAAVWWRRVRNATDRFGTGIGRQGGGFARDESGFVLVFLAVALPALLGLVGLAIDANRLMTRDTELAGAADAAAKAAAQRLDRSDTAVGNARAAANAIFDRAELGGASLTLRFAANLPDLRADNGSASLDPAGADTAYVEAMVSDDGRLMTSFIQLVGARATPIRRRATAESLYLACDVTPLVMCQSDPDAFARSAREGRQYLLRMDGNRVNGSILPLDRGDATGPRGVLAGLASNGPAFCYADGVRLRQNVEPAEYDAAVNVRFDRYAGRSGPIDPDLARFPPAPTVIQGRHLESCAAPPQGGDINPPYPLPRDSAYQGVRLSGLWDQGLGDWRTAPAIGGTGRGPATALDEYLAWNHANKTPLVLEGFRASLTRYELYLRELGLTPETADRPVDTRSYGGAAATMPTGGPGAGSLANVRERSTTMCYAGTLPATDARRRLLYMSIADCNAFPGAASAVNLSKHVAKFFMTEPFELGSAPLEFVGMVRPGPADGKLRQLVRLVEAR